MMLYTFLLFLFSYRLWYEKGKIKDFIVLEDKSSWIISSKNVIKWLN